jgi:hypothetical protein
MKTHKQKLSLHFAIGVRIEMPNPPKSRGKRNYTGNVSKKRAAPKRKPARARVQQTPGVTQGVGAVTRRPFGSVRINPTNVRLAASAMNATNAAHLSLPINTGPYTVMRTTTIVKSSDSFMGFGFFRGAYDEATITVSGVPSPPVGISERASEGWAPFVAFGAPSLTTSPSVSTNFYGCPQLATLGEGATLTPAAMTVQIMNGKSLQLADGIFYLGRSRTQLRLQDSATDWQTIGQDFVSYQAPRLCSGGKLALRGIKVDSMPFNIQELMDFDRIIGPPLTDAAYSDNTLAWSSISKAAADGTRAENRRVAMKGFSPTCVYNPEERELQYIVTCEWRVRFSYTHAASSTHTHHAAADTKVWDSVSQIMASAGHGAVDIAQNVAYEGAQSMAASFLM